MNILLSIVLSFLVFLLLGYLAFRLLRLAWYKLHQMAGIEVGMSQYSLPTAYQTSSRAALQPTRMAYQTHMPIPNTFGNDSRFEVMPSFRTTERKQKFFKLKTNFQAASVPSILGIELASIERMPTSAVMLLDQIHDKLVRYQDWQHTQNQQANSNQQIYHQTQWLTENKFVVNRLIEQTIPEAVNQYDQIAKYHPHQLNQKIHGEMTAGEILIDVLARVNQQLDELLNEMFHEVSQQFVSTYRYVKNRT